MTPEMKDIIGNLGLDPTESWLDRNFFLEDNENPKKKRTRKKRATKSPYSITKVKTRNFLINIGYKRIKGKDSDNISFIADVFSFILKDFNPFF